MNPKSPEARNSDEKPFEGMNISNASALDALKSRSACPKCGKSRMYFCYTCFLPVTELKDRIPICNLPIKVDIIKHRREIDGKSTAAHAAVLAPNDVNVYTYPDIPNYELDNHTVLLFPGTEAQTVPELFAANGNSIPYTECILSELPHGYNVGTLMKKIVWDVNSPRDIYHVNKLPIDRVVLIDSTWNQARGIFANEKLQKLPKIVLQTRPSQFWRHQKGSPRWYLSTIEALHQLLLELHMCAWGRSENYLSHLTMDYSIHEADNHQHCIPYQGQYDNLLFFFKYMYEKLHSLYKHEDLLAYKRHMI